MYFFFTFSFTIAVDYFQSRYPGTTIVFDISLVYIVMAFFAVLGNNILVETLSLNTRITFGNIYCWWCLYYFWSVNNDDKFFQDTWFPSLLYYLPLFLVKFGGKCSDPILLTQWLWLLWQWLHLAVQVKFQL